MMNDQSLLLHDDASGGHGHDEDEVVSRNKMELAMRVICNHLKMESGIP